MNKLNYLQKYISYKAKATNAHGIHPPFLFELYNNVIVDQTPFYAFSNIESIRAKLLLSNLEIEINDFGAGSSVNKSKKRAINDIAKNTLKAPKYGQLLFRLVNRFKPTTVLELGTSLGISSMYLATANSKTKVTTVEGCPNVTKVAKVNFDKIGLKNIELVNAQFDVFLPEYLKRTGELDFVFFDGNHTKEATLNYFNLCLPKANKNTVFVFDDIYWSKGMNEAWDEIKKHPKITLTVDLFALGIVFFNTDLSKEDFVLRY
ncbi:class I SAM-dependent methyltransferase [Vicingus serpentipes]|uniref:Class I SAM-dependent methyltransferase n=1 Tax=Vicingus serpentipes TaxID=1926625 RepID=A0A5C6RTA0_9FLAO|nr:class I SAM-dependent methyltransferase [Vicingus serpentipes]TXB65377.1 class I SAM-dependent methyltransferase [Vicingus serpentipes]